MRIGVDFDNTVVDYDALFHKVAVEQGAVPAELPPTKLAVRGHLRAVGREEIWTEMQGYVYGARMDEAVAYPGVLDFFRWARDNDVAIHIISHKTRHPFLGPRYDLHEAARRWVASHLAELIPAGAVFFELTKEEKLRRIGAVTCGWYIDDLPEILLDAAFPPQAVKILFDPETHHAQPLPLLKMSNWTEILRYFKQQCPTPN